MADTIYALATAPGKAGLCVLRISGPRAFDILTALGGGEVPLRSARVRALKDGAGGVLDQALVLTFGAGRSFTGEDVVELHLHGSIAVQRAVFARLEELGLARMAKPGEFTRRALLNGRMDLTEVQGLADVIEAETEEQRRAAMRVMGGEMSGLILGWRSRLIRAAALMEATIDFADEEVPVDVMPEVVELLSSVVDEMAGEASGSSAAKALREGFEVAIVGAPNAGKSSLLNAIVRSDAALVSEIPGTTRDVIERAVDLQGLKVIFVDTAGLRETDDPVERLGVARAKERAEAADMRLFLHEEESVPAFPVARAPHDLVCRTKADLHGGEGLSSRTGAGLDALLEAIAAHFASVAGSAGFVSRTQDEMALREAIAALTSALETCYLGDVELVVFELRKAVTVLERIVGQIGVEDVLDEVFRSFCLGK
ncbi:tRNA uridine-5-carboxymethylaminomethyl(34) synthesis GTPase MnmE [Jannaschia formosa]|uniref:tRNA uridine-5-carboxymethylaminomethyl(34) synthesis GTPase MnmE n=1 Tax=Jannaschia formosa TaxID=2259592 RepID=UPI000E1C1C8C|nr:tRNA uridine-5-carboxymethylaminomethyl(34) synthesis GTPase MnmE [Jannaschia formosa]TFL17554.1 tRNA uridine-5-carboxymethylaminomethyl(34) synthesis GTPase MnmE [Jannaschia formosa]